MTGNNRGITVRNQNAKAVQHDQVLSRHWFVHITHFKYEEVKNASIDTLCLTI
jgi:hypothetical protein